MSFTEEEVEVAWQATLRSGSTEWANMIDHYKKRYIAFANALPVKREGEPIGRENIREGDLVRGIRPSHTPGSHSNPARREATIIGEVYKSLDGRLVVGGAYLENLTDLRLISSPLPKLEPGMLVRVDEWADGNTQGQIVFIRKMKTGELLEAIFPDGTQVKTYWITKWTQIYPEPQSQES